MIDNIKCCVIDDEPLAAHLIASYVEKTPYLTLSRIFHNASEAVQELLDSDIELIFLDIHMPALNGLELARITSGKCRVIFTTAYVDYAIEGFKVNALDYLLKPVSYDEFLSAAQKALEWKELTSRPEDHDSGKSTDSRISHIVVKSGYRMQQIAVSDIIYIEGQKDYVMLYLDGEERPIMTLMNMKALEQTLPTSSFLRVHRSYIANTSKIKVIERNRISFGGLSIPIGDSYRQQLADYIESHSIMAIRPERP